MKTIGLFLLIAATLFTSCNKDEENLIVKPIINGSIQKGPFLNGTSVEIYELGSDFSQTGKAYSSQILNNSGSFQISNITLVSNFVQLKADGYYFNEISNQNSNSPITLYAVADVTDKNTVNVNILSHLQKGRIEQLISDGYSFPEANEQAKTEILHIFSISKPDISDFDLLDISQAGEDNAILLAISLITQGFRTESELSVLLANISTDIREDGILDNQTLGSSLINDARLFDLSACRENIRQRYENLGMNVSIPDFEKYIREFVENTTYQITNNITYPEFSNYGENVLFGDKTSFNSRQSLAANLPKGTSLKIIIKEGTWWYQSLPNAPVNWTVSDYDFSNEQQIFTATESGKDCDLIIEFEPGTHLIEYYENNASSPTRMKTITR